MAGLEAKLEKETAHWRSTESEATASKSTLPRGSQMIHLIPSTASGDDIHLRSSLGTQFPEFPPGAKLSRKVNVQHRVE